MKLNWKRVLLVAVFSELLILYFNDIQSRRAPEQNRQVQLHTPAPGTETKNGSNGQS